MFQVFGFIFKCIGEFIEMLFSIDIGPMSLGLFMCIIFIFLPIFLAIVNFLKGTLFEEFDDRYDNGRDSIKGYQPKHVYQPRHAKRGGK